MLIILKNYQQTKYQNIQEIANLKNESLPQLPNENANSHEDQINEKQDLNQQLSAYVTERHEKYLESIKDKEKNSEHTLQENYLENKSVTENNNNQKPILVTGDS